MHFRRFIAAIAVLCAIVSPCHAQKTKAQLNTEITNSYPDNHAGAITPQVLRNVSSDVVNSIMPTAPVISGNTACFDGTTGLLKDCGQAPTSIILTAGTGVSLSGTCSGSSFNCTIGVNAGTQVVFPSRTIAEAINLSGLSAVTTQGYAAAGDGGGATFKNVGSNPFLDSFVTSTAISAAGSGCTNGTYFGTGFNGGTGTGVVGTVTVSGGIVTTVSIVNSPGNGYSVNDVLTISSVIGCSNAAITVTGVSTPLASFIDAGGNHWQYIVDAGNFPNTRQFGAKVDGDGTGLGTDDTASIQAALWYTGRRGAQNPDSGGFEGGTLIQPVGVSNICTQTGLALVVPFGVKYSGSWGGSTLRVCDNIASNASVIFLGDPQTHLASLRSTLANMTVFGKRGIAAATGAAMIVSNNTQDGGGLDHVYIYAAQRECIDFETGYGGASTVYMNDISCSLEGANTGAVFNYGTTMVNMKNMVFGAPSSGTNNTQLTMELFGGMYHIEGFHTEHIPIGIAVNMSGTINENMVTMQDLTGGTNCSSLIELLAANTPGNASIQQAANNGCTVLVTDGQPGGTNRAGPVTPVNGIVFFNP